MKNTKKMVITALCMAIGIILPITLHAIPNAGSILLPMHIPVLLCGLICGPVYGVICGVMTPFLSSLLTGMPPAAYLPSMIFELLVYGLIAGLMMILLKEKKGMAKYYVALISAMVLGRIVFGIMNACFFQAGNYSLSIWMTAAFVTAFPGIVIQLILIPVIMVALQKAHLTETL